MKQFTPRVRRNRRALFLSQAIVACIGVGLSVVLHELFHVAMHWGSIESVHLFTSSGALVQIISHTQPGYNVNGEEAIAYTISFATLVITAVSIAAIHDAYDRRSFSQTVFHRSSPLHSIDKDELFALAARLNLL